MKFIEEDYFKLKQKKQIDTYNKDKLLCKDLNGVYYL